MVCAAGLTDGRVQDSSASDCTRQQRHAAVHFNSYEGYHQDRRRLRAVCWVSLLSLQGLPAHLDFSRPLKCALVSSTRSHMLTPTAATHCSAAFPHPSCVKQCMAPLVWVSIGSSPIASEKRKAVCHVSCSAPRHRVVSVVGTTLRKHSASNSDAYLQLSTFLACCVFVQACCPRGGPLSRPWRREPLPPSSAPPSTSH